MLTENEITFSPERDGYPGVAVAFVIDGEVIYTKSFKPSFANDYLLAATSFEASSKMVSSTQVDTVIVNSPAGSAEIAVSEMLTAILLSTPTIVRLTIDNGKHVSVGWKHDQNGFYVTRMRNGEYARFAGSGQYV